MQRDYCVIDSNSWWLKRKKEEFLFDKFILNSIKVVYLGVRVFLKLTLGKKRRDRIYIQKGISFKEFFYKSVKFLAIDNLVLVEIMYPNTITKYVVALTKKILVAPATIHEEDMILDHFNPKQSDVVIDLGANIGLYAYYSFEACRCERKGSCH